jgi:tetratricopeptide (TPR) repeat protein
LNGCDIAQQSLAADGAIACFSSNPFSLSLNADRAAAERSVRWLRGSKVCRMDHSVEYKRLAEIYETVTYGESDDHLLLQTVNQLIEELGCLTTAEPKNSDAFHLLGLCWYEFPEISADTQRHAEKAFRDALAIDPEHQYANLFLGHVLFDMMRYEEADQRFAMIDPKFFIARTQQWRVVKNDELRLCCRLELEPASVTFHELDALCQRYETDRELPVPGEIVSCLDRLVRGDGLAPVQLETYISRVLAMLEVSDNVNVAYLQEPIMRLRSSVAL